MISTKFQKFAVVIVGAIAFSGFGLLPKIVSQAVPNTTYIASQHPLGVALAAAREEGYVDSGTWQETIEIQHNSAETLDQAKITITQKGFLDDSVQGHRFLILLEKDTTGQWQTIDIQKNWLCRRGHDFLGNCL